MQLWVIVRVFWRAVIPNGGKRGVGRKYGSADNARIKLYPCFIVLQWQYSVNLTVTHAFEFLWTYTDVSVFHISQRCRCVIVWMLMIHITGTIKKETCCCTCARLLLSLTFSSVARCTNHSLGWCWYTPVNGPTMKAFYTVAVCVYRVHSHLHWKNTCKAEGFSGDSEVIQKHWEQRCKCFSKYCWCIERSASATLLQSNWELSHFLRPLLNNKALMPFSFKFNTVGSFLKIFEPTQSQSEDKTAFSNLEIRLAKDNSWNTTKTCFGPFKQRDVFLKM